MRDEKKNLVTAALDDLAADVDKRFRQPMDQLLRLIESVREMKFSPELEHKIAEELRRLKGMGYRDAQLGRISRGCDALEKTLANMAIR